MRRSQVRTLAEASIISPARAAAAHVLLAVERGTAHADEQLRTPRIEALSRQDRDLTTELVMGTLRWQRVLDREISARLRYPGSDMHLSVIIALRLGAYQLLFLDRIPAHAALNESVELAKQADGLQMAGLTNAVLRRLLRERATLQSLRSDPAAAYPEWMVARWRTRFGDDATQAICGYGQHPPRATLRLAHDATTETPASFLSRAVDAEGPVAAASVRQQDEASQLVGELAAFHAGDAILDACAAPAGKTAILAERNPSAEITAVDISAARLRIAARRFAWTDKVHFTPADVTLLAPEPRYSGVLCDVPCSGTGTLARNPEIRHRLEPPALGRQAERQQAILLACLRTLRAGGRLVYSTCSLEPEENEQVVEQVLAAFPKARLLPVEPELRAMHEAGILTAAGIERLLASALSGPYLRTVPGVHTCDGFFAALLTVD
jgi:16S rRNA (cytosine967-C5)-methyltransferase